MFNPALEGVGRRLATIGAMAALMVGLGASNAFASITLVGPGPYEEPSATIEKVEVTAPGFAPFNEADIVAVAECNLTGILGTRCNAKGAPMPAELSGGSHTFLNVSIEREFTNFDFTKQGPGEGETECFSLADLMGKPCGIVASYYEDLGGGALKQLGSESESFWFE
ncbi:MAG TPA: hypothetical protein VG898_00930 [Solirubrobacterales bacterium]|nr:hypothetical protein [Solirubrobacterales bacterium]